MAIATGSVLGEFRTGALGGAAVQALLTTPVDTVGVIGAGRQAWTQLWALSGFTRPKTVRLHSRTRARGEDFARRAAA